MCLVPLIVQAAQSDAKRLKPSERPMPFGERHPLAPRLPNGASQPPGNLSSSTVQLKPQVSAAAPAPSASGSGSGGGNLLLKSLHKPAEAASAEGSQAQTVEFGKHSTSSTPSQVRRCCPAMWFWVLLDRCAAVAVPSIR